MADLVTVFSCDTAHEAHIVRGMLESAGIPAFLSNEHLVSAQWMYATAVGGVKVRVRDEDAGTALELLREAAAQDARASASPSGLAGMSSGPEDKNGRTAGACPRCGSPGEPYRYRGLFSALSLGLFIPFPQARYRWHCPACGKKWR